MSSQELDGRLARASLGDESPPGLLSSTDALGIVLSVLDDPRDLLQNVELVCKELCEASRQPSVWRAQCSALAQLAVHSWIGSQSSLDLCSAPYALPDGASFTLISILAAPAPTAQSLVRVDEAALDAALSALSLAALRSLAVSLVRRPPQCTLPTRSRWGYCFRTLRLSTAAMLAVRVAGDLDLFAYSRTGWTRSLACRAGAPVYLSASYQVFNNEAGLGCIAQLVVGLVSLSDNNLAAPPVCLWSGMPYRPHDGVSDRVQLAASLPAGEYALRAQHHLQYSERDAIALFPQFAADESTTAALITVS